MLVLYVLTFAALKVRTDQREIELQKWRRVQEIEKSVNEIDKKERFFEYQSKYKKHVLKTEIKFRNNSSNINDIGKSAKKELLAAGKMVTDLINSFKNDRNVNYLVIIEGQASKDGYDLNDQLSYKRALALKNFWRKNNIDIEKFANCELLIAGSGEGGIPRIQPDKPPANQRFLIHIIPKVGDINAEN